MFFWKILHKIYWKLFWMFPKVYYRNFFEHSSESSSGISNESFAGNFIWKLFPIYFLQKFFFSKVPAGMFPVDPLVILPKIFHLILSKTPLRILGENALEIVFEISFMNSSGTFSWKSSKYPLKILSKCHPRIISEIPPGCLLSYVFQKILRLILLKVSLGNFA